MSAADRISELGNILQNCVEGKEAIADALTSKGVATKPEDSFDTMAVNVGLIEGGSASNMFFTPVSRITVGRTFSIPCDYTKCIIILDMVSAASIIGGFGYNRKVVNAGTIHWTTGDDGYSQIVIDNNNFIISSMGFFDKNSTVVTSLHQPTERILNIQPNWINVPTPVSGGYWTVILEE